MKCAVFWICVMMVPCAFGEGAGAGFMHFNAPGVVGAYQAPWVPVGPTDKGYIFGIGFLMSGGDESSPLVMWIPRTGRIEPSEIRSIASINAVAGQISAGEPQQVRARRTIEIITQLIASTAVNKGGGGFSLDSNSRSEPRWIIARLCRAGLGEDTAAMLRELAGQSRLAIGEKEWTRSWVEVDSLGAIEKITISGIADPASLKSVQVESLYGAGTIEPAILRKERAIQQQDLK